MVEFLKASLNSRTGVEKALWIFLLLSVAAISFSIAVTHIFLTVTTMLYFYWKLRFNREFPRLPILLPAIVQGPKSKVSGHNFGHWT